MNVIAPVIDIRVESPLTTDARLLIDASQKHMERVYPPEEIFSMTPEELASRNIQFLVARLDDRPVGCVALVDQVSYGEIKRLFVDGTARGRGIAGALLAELEDMARDIGLTVLRLETGPELRSAVTVYRKMGYQVTNSFGDYADLPCSLFMEKRLGWPPSRPRPTGAAIAGVGRAELS